MRMKGKARSIGNEKLNSQDKIEKGKEISLAG